MSSGSQLRSVGGAIVGGAIGFISSGFNPAGALKGAAIGYSIGSSFNATVLDSIEGPRLESLEVQTADAGSYIKEVHGGDEITGTVIWLKGNEIDETITREDVETGGKGGGGSKQTTTTYTYSATFAIGLTSTLVSGVSKIFADSVLIFDATSADVSSLVQSEENSDLFTLYNDGSNNTTSSLMEADIGADIPAFRNVTRIEFDNLQLSDFGNRIPNIRVVAFDSTSGSETDPELLRLSAGGNAFPEGIINSSTGSNIFTMPSLYEDGVITAFKIELAALSTDGSAGTYTNVPRVIKLSLDADDTSILLQEQEIKINFDNLPWTPTSLNMTTSDLKLFPIVNDPSQRFIMTYIDTNSVVRTTVTDLLDYHKMIFDNPPAIATDVFHYLRGDAFGISNGALVKFNAVGSRFALRNNLASISTLSGNGNVYICAGVDGVSGKLFAVLTGGTTLHEIDILSLEVLQAYTLSTTAIAGDLVISHGGDVISYSNGSTFTTVKLTLSPNTATELGTFGNKPADPILVLNCSSLNSFVRDFATPHSVPGGTTETYLTTGNNFTDSSNTDVDKAIIELLNTNPFLNFDDIDVADIATENIGGYTIPQYSSIGGKLKPLMQAYQFGIYEENYQIKFRSRSNAANIATIEAEDLQAHEKGQAPPDEVIQTSKADVDVPTRLNISYRDSDKEFEINVQSAERFNAEGASTKEISLTMSLTADKAAQIAEILLADVISESKGFIEIRTNFKYSHVEREDLITINATDKSYTILITDKEFGRPGIVVIRGILIDSANYTSTAVGETGTSPAATLTPISQTELVLFDTVPLRDSDSDFGFYYAVYPRNPNGRWSGATVAASRDSVQWTNVTTLLNAVTFGSATDALTGTTLTTVFDSSQTLNIITTSGTLTTATEDQVKANSANVLIYGEPGRWEIVKFVTATLEGDGSYTVSQLIRGYWGTENNIGNHEVGDSVILMSNDTVRRYGLTSDSDFDNYFSLIATTFNKFFQKTQIKTYQAIGVGSNYPAPVHIKATRDASDDITFSWFRQKLTGREWSNINWLETDTFNFEVDVLNGAGGAVLRTITASGSNAPFTVAYTSAEQVTDFGSNQTSIYVNIYQLESTTGRGVVGQGLAI